MRRLLAIFIVALSASLAAPAAYAQTVVTNLDRLEIELWPDYDRPALLVLLTGVLPPGTATPATVTIPIPANADINAVARISDTSEMIDDITYNTQPGQNEQQRLTFTTPDLRFRVEYYLPYTITDGQHRFNFTWQSDLDIVFTAILVQQPLNATNFNLDPPAPTVQPRDQGINYHIYPEQPTIPGQSFTVQGSYTLSPNQLSAAALATAQAAGNPPGSSTAIPATPPAEPSPLTNWPIIMFALTGLFLLALAAWQFLRQRPATAAPARPCDPPSRRPPAQTHPQKPPPRPQKRRHPLLPPLRQTHRTRRPLLPQLRHSPQTITPQPPSPCEGERPGMSIRAFYFCRICINTIIGASTSDNNTKIAPILSTI